VAAGSRHAVAAVLCRFLRNGSENFTFVAHNPEFRSIPRIMMRVVLRFIYSISL